MNVTEAVDSLSAMFPPLVHNSRASPACRVAHFPLVDFSEKKESPPEAPSFNIAVIWGAKVLFFIFFK